MTLPTTSSPFLIGMRREVIHQTGYLKLGNDDRVINPLIDTRNVGIHLGDSLGHYAPFGIEGKRCMRCIDGIWRIVFAPESYSRLVDTGVAVDALSEEGLTRPNEEGGLNYHSDLTFEDYANGLLAVAERNIHIVKPDVPLYMRPFIAETACQLGVDSTEGWLFSIITRDMDPYLGKEADTGVTLWAPGPNDFCRTDKRCGLADKKASMNYVRGKKAKRKAKKLYGANDVLQCGLDGNFKECTGQNMFLRAGDTWYTAELDGSLLPGINRRRAIAILRAMGRQVIECQITHEMLSRANEIFLTGTWTGIVPVRIILYGPTNPQPVQAPFHDEDPGSDTLEVRRIHTALTTFDLDAIPHQMAIDPTWWLEVT